MSTRAILDHTLEEFSQTLGDLSRRLGSPTETVAFLRELGWDWPEDQWPEDLPILQHITSLASLVVQLMKAPTDVVRLKLAHDLVAQVNLVMSDIRNISDSFANVKLSNSCSLDLEDLKQKLPQQLLDYTLIEFLKRHHWAAYGFLRFIGAIEETFEEPQNGRPGYTSRVVHADRLGAFLQNPEQFAEGAFKWNTANFEAQKLLDLVESVFVDLAIPAGQYMPNPTMASKLLGIPAPALGQMGRELRIILMEVSDPDVGYLELTLGIYPLPDKDGLLPGVALIPSLTGELGTMISLGGALELQLSGDWFSGVAIEFRPTGTVVRTNLLAEETSMLRSELQATLRSTRPPATTTVFGQSGQSSLEFRELFHVLGVSADAKGIVDSYWEINLAGGVLRISCGEGDGFLKTILPEKPIESSFDLAIGWSSQRGIYFRGSSALEVTIPVHKAIGPLEIDSIWVRLALDNGIPRPVILTSISTKLGPIAVTVSRWGLEIPVGMPAGGGNAGPFQIDGPKFVSPTRVGLAVDASGLTGGGYLDIDPDNKRYAGILTLNFGKIGLTAIGLITTKMPDGKPGFAMLLSICAKFTPPIQLSFGFTLSDVGGLIGINRTVNVEALRAGLRNRALDAILFPEDPIRDAPTIISTLESVFPTQEGRYVIGPMLKGGWGSPTLIEIELAVIIELPGPSRIVVLGQLAALLPKKEAPLIEIHLDVLGVIDFAGKSLAIDATLYNSRILEFALSGDAALRLSWGDNPQFGLSLGGFHPKFSPPPNFPALRRLTLDLGAGDALQLSCQMYLAVTSNSLQFGAQAELYAKAGPASISGYLGFDTLIYFSPFSFEVSIRAGMVIKIKGHTLAGIAVSMLLSGPTPWHAEGKVKIEILFFDITVRFNVTWGGRSDKLTSGAVDPWPALKEALERPESWGSVFPPERSAGEAIRSLKIQPATGAAAQPGQQPIILHPAGGVEIRQNVLPLGIQLDKFGNAPIKGPSRFDELRVVIAPGNGLGASKDAEDYFARGQFQDLTDDEKLSLPSFELMRCGIKVGMEAISFGAAVEWEVEYESIPSPEKEEPVKTSWSVAVRQVTGNAAGRCGLRTSGNRKFQVSGQPPKVKVQEEGYSIVDETASVQALQPGSSPSGRRLTRLEADQELRNCRDRDPEHSRSLRVVPTYELESKP